MSTTDPNSPQHPRPAPVPSRNRVMIAVFIVLFFLIIAAGLLIGWAGQNAAT